jgi:monoamine oxidase
MEKPVDVTIIGAGACGLAATIRLLELDPSLRVRLLEAAPVTGGRMQTVILDNGAPFDTGGHWLHGGPDNLFYQWAHDRYPSLSFTEDPGGNSYTELPPGQTNVTDEELNRLFKRRYRAFKTQHPDRDISLLDLGEGDPSPAVQIYMLGAARLWMAMEDPAQVSGDELFGSGDGNSSGGMQVEGGIGRLTALMTEEAGDRGAEILTGSAVEAIYRTGDEVRIFCADGQMLRSTYALATWSVGVQQSGRVAHTPALPRRITGAFNGLVMGHMGKIAQPLRASFMAAGGVTPNMFLDNPVENPSNFCHAFSGGAKAVTVFAGGDEAVRMEALDKEGQSACIARVFNAIGLLAGYRPFIAGRPAGTGWSRNPFTRGSYSSQLPGGKRHGPLRAGRLMFAGEALAERDSSTMQGAFRSGLKAAALLNRLLHP